MLRLILHITVLITMLFPLREITLFQHFCGIKLIHFELLESTSASCCGVSDESCSGCKDVDIILSIDEFQAPQITITIPNLGVAQSIAYRPEINVQVSNSGYSTFFLYRDPPVKSGKRLSILNQSFLL